MTTDAQTIIAQATPPGRGALGILRLSGPEAWAICRRMVRLAASRRRGFQPRPWRAYLGEVLGGSGRLRLDQVVVVFYRAPASYSGEDMVEITGHGSPYLLERLAEEAVALGARPAHPGEFTLRAFERGKMDLAQAEAMDALIRAGSLGEVLGAMESLGGGPSRRVRALAERMEEALARLEAGIEFPEEMGAQEPVGPAPSELTALEGELGLLSAEYRRGRILREGLRVTLSGRANVGKSCVFNRLLHQRRALVTASPGTTRDVVEAAYRAGEVEVRLADTAGIQRPRSAADREGILRGREAWRRAEIRLVVADASRPLTSADRELVAAVSGRPGLVLLNKLDLADGRAHLARLRQWGAAEVLGISARTGRGFRELERRLAALAGEVWERTAGRGGGPLVNLRQKRVLDAARASLTSARRLLEAGAGEELAAHHLRQAVETLQGYGGRGLPERLLGRIFQRFCIGK